MGTLLWVLSWCAAGPVAGAGALFCPVGVSAVAWVVEWGGRRFRVPEGPIPLPWPVGFVFICANLYRGLLWRGEERGLGGALFGPVGASVVAWVVEWGERGFRVSVGPISLPWPVVFVFICAKL